MDINSENQVLLPRINKYISSAGHCSRRKAEELVKEGRVKINGVVVRDLSFRVGGEVVMIDNAEIRVHTSTIHWMFYKPSGVLCSRVSQGDKPTLFELPSLAKIPFKFEPIGRLDFASEGLMILTNDGEMTQRLSHPSFGCEKYYQVLVNKKLEKDQVLAMKKGTAVKEFRPIKIRFLNSVKLGATSGFWYTITLGEGKNRLIRRLFETYDIKVVRLVRFGIADLRLDSDLKPGECRALTSKEIQNLKI